ncbi:MAG: hypothetical protein J6N54_09100 [Bacteroidales bacterium]|nr:hypothetical protein [Bacteroidales bacterium]
MKRTLICFLVALTAFLSSCGDNDPRLVIITFDGLRWQELYGGVDSTLVGNPKYVDDPEGLKAKYWRATPQERRSVLMPFTWSYIEKNGYMLGNRLKGSQFQVANAMSFSYPGYSEMFCGWADDERVNSNAAIPNPNTSVLEVANADPRYNGSVMVYGSWNSIRYAVNNERGGFPGSVSYEPDIASATTPALKLLNEMQEGMPHYWGEERFDAFTYGYALETMKKDHPKVMWIAFGDTDEWAHAGKYDFYVEAAHGTDQMIRRIVEYCESDPFYKGKTTYLLTTDHGRGKRGAFTSHSNGTKGSETTWMMAFGKGIEPLGETSGNGPFFTRQFAATIAEILGIDFTPSNGEKQPAIDPGYKGTPLPEDSGIKDMGYFHEIQAVPKGSGMRFKYFEGPFMSVDELSKSKVLESGILESLSIDGAKAKDHFGYEFNGLLKIPASGSYTFTVASDDGTKVFLDDRLIVDNDGSHSVDIVEVKVAMDAGFHRFKVLYFDDTEGQELEVGLFGGKLAFDMIPASMLFYD